MTDTHTRPLPSIDTLKKQAKRLRASLNAASVNNSDISHSQSLELIARQYGFRDWNTAHASAGNGPPGFDFSLGARVAGKYLGHPFTGKIVAAAARAQGYTRISIQFDTPVDVITFESFSAYRSRVNATVNTHGITAEKTSNGAPQMILERM